VAQKVVLCLAAPVQLLPLLTAKAQPRQQQIQQQLLPAALALHLAAAPADDDPADLAPAAAAAAVGSLSCSLPLPRTAGVQWLVKLAPLLLLLLGLALLLCLPAVLRAAGLLLLLSGTPMTAQTPLTQLPKLQQYTME
jgi:hypothetical protein